jgi:hypothetical protein
MPIKSKKEINESKKEINESKKNLLDNNISNIENDLNKEKKSLLKIKKFKFINPPIIIGNNAMNFYKLKEISDINEMLISKEDFEELSKNNNINNSSIETKIIENNNIYYLNIYYMDYSTIILKAVKYKNKYYIDKQSLILLNTINAFNKRDKIQKNNIKQNLENLQLLVNSVLNNSL